MAETPIFEPAKNNPDPAGLSDVRDETAVKVDDPGGSHAVGYAADAAPPEPPAGVEPYPLEGEPKRPEGTS